MTISVIEVQSANAQGTETWSVLDHKASMEEERDKSAPLSISMSTSGIVGSSTLPVVRTSCSFVAPAAITSEPVTTSDVHCVESSGKLSMSFADGLDLDFKEDESNGSWSNEGSDDDDSELDVSLVDSDDDDVNSDSSESNEDEVNDDSTSSITGHNDETDEVFTSQSFEIIAKEPVSTFSEGGCVSHTDSSSESFLADEEAESIEQDPKFNENDKMETASSDGKETANAPTKIDSVVTRRGLQRKPTGDSDTLGKLFHGLTSGCRDDEHLANKNVRRGRRNDSGDVSDAGHEERNVEDSKKGPMRTRRGVQRIPTGDSDTLVDMIQRGSKCISDSAPAPLETTRRGGRRKLKNDAQVEVIGIVETVKSKEPLKTRRGVQRKATGDSDTLVALVHGMDPAGATSLETSKVRRGGRKKERPSEDVKDPADLLSETKGPLRTRKGLRRQATGDSDTLAELIASKRNNAA